MTRTQAKDILFSAAAAWANGSDKAVEIFQAIEVLNETKTTQQMIPPLQLTRPLVSIDVESTGLSLTQDRILALAIVKMIPMDVGKPLIAQHEFWFNPGFSIPPLSTRVHGITDEMVADKPMFNECAREIMMLIGGYDLLGYNLKRFDVPILHEHFYRAGLEWNLEGIHVIDASAIFQQKEPRDLTAAVRKFVGRSHDGAHGALADAVATVDVLAGQRSHYEDLGMMTVAELSKFSERDEVYLDLAQKLKIGFDGRPAYAFGEKMKDVAIEDDVRNSDYGRSYADWMLNKADFPQDTCRALRKVLDDLNATTAKTEELFR